jgi:16S rRNA (guanine1207-N2)-methyltransferase
VLPDVTGEFLTDRGVFSCERVDPGTKYLLLEGPKPPADAANLLDLGCGYGPIAVTLARRAPGATVWAIDVNERALGLCAENAKALDVMNVRVVLAGEPGQAHEMPDDLRFDAIYSNPPIHIGKPAMQTMLTAWFDRLVDRGHAYLVVQKHLGSDSLQQWLVERGYPTVRLGSRAGYRILDVTRTAVVA